MKIYTLEIELESRCRVENKDRFLNEKVTVAISCASVISIPSTQIANRIQMICIKYDTYEMYLNRTRATKTSQDKSRTVKHTK